MADAVPLKRCLAGLGALMEIPDISRNCSFQRFLRKLQQSFESLFFFDLQNLSLSFACCEYRMAWIILPQSQSLFSIPLATSYRHIQPRRFRTLSSPLSLFRSTVSQPHYSIEARTTNHPLTRLSLLTSSAPRLNVDTIQTPV